MLVLAGMARNKCTEYEKTRKGFMKVIIRDMETGLYLKGQARWGDTMAAVKYVVTEKGARIYSVGSNGKDDGGLRRGTTKGADDVGVGIEIGTKDKP